MPSIVKILRVVADPNRLRILLLLRAEELSVAELQEILVMGQSTISTHLSQLKQAGLVEDRRTGKSNLYHLAAEPAEELAVLKGHYFSRPDSAINSGGPLGPEVPSAASAPTPLSESAPLGESGPREKSLPEGAAENGTTPLNLRATHGNFTPPASLEKSLPEGAADNSPGQAKRSPGNAASQSPSPVGATAPPNRISDRAGTPSKSTAGSFLHNLLDRARQEIPEAASDQAAMRSVLRKRQDKMRAFFDSVAGRLGKDYVPGQSWKGVAEALLRLMPPMTIADLGAGEGTFSLLLAQRAKKVIAVDASAKMIEVSRDQALRHGIHNVEFRLGDMEELPIADREVDLVFFSQSLHHALHPDRAVEEAARILVPGGRIVLLDLVKHRFEEARELYADEWLGFSEAELESMLAKAAFTDIQTSVVHKEPESPQFQTLLAVANKPVQ